MNSRTLASLLAGGLACGSPGPCPPGTRADVARAGELLATLRHTEAGRRAAADVEAAAICFGGAVRGAVRPGRVVVLADSLAREHAAARLAHLLAHLSDGLDRFPAADLPCAPQIASALAAEARGIVAEIEVWDALGRAGDPPYAFGLAVLAAAAAERPGLVLARLRAASGDAADELHAVARDYHDRCTAHGETPHDHR